jgi:hypothetical protein
VGPVRPGVAHNDIGDAYLTRQLQVVIVERGDHQGDAHRDWIVRYRSSVRLSIESAARPPPPLDALPAVGHIYRPPSGA